MKKLIKLFSLISVFTLCLGMTLFTTNKTNVKAQEVDLYANVDLPLPSGFYVYNYGVNSNLYFLYNSADNGGKHYYTDILFKATPGSGGGEITESMNVIIGAPYYSIYNAPSIESDIYAGVTSNALIDIVLKDFTVYDVSDWFLRITGPLHYIQIQRAMYEPVSNLYINDDNFLDLYVLSNSLLKDYGTDISYSVILNHDRANDYYYSEGWNAGYDEGKQEGLEEGRQEVCSPVEYFLYEFNNWIIPAIAVAVFGGGLFMLFSRKREV